jgi:hypothetical protein
VHPAKKITIMQTASITDRGTLRVCISFQSVSVVAIA